MDPVRDRRRAARRRAVRRRRRVVAIAAIIVVVLVVLTLRAHGGVVQVASNPRDSGLFSGGVRVDRSRFHSRTLARTLDEVVVLPPGYAKDQHRPLLVFLHGRSSKPTTLLNDELRAALKDAGDRAPVVLLANGGDHSYYHDRRDGKWASHITKELAPAMVRKYDLDPARVAYAGISMGGYGALELTRESRTKRCGVAGIAPALWMHAGDSAAGAFDDADDFARHDPLGAVRANPNALHGTPVFLAGGSGDPFRPGTDAMAAALHSGPSKVVRKRGAGGHDGTYWNPQFRPMISWFAARFADC